MKRWKLVLKIEFWFVFNFEDRVVQIFKTLLQSQTTWKKLAENAVLGHFLEDS